MNRPGSALPAEAFRRPAPEPGPVSYTHLLDGFRDAAQVSSYAEAALKWAVGSELITGKTGNLLDPRGNATRAEIATILMRLIQK